MPDVAVLALICSTSHLSSSSPIAIHSRSPHHRRAVTISGRPTRLRCGSGTTRRDPVLAGAAHLQHRVPAAARRTAVGTMRGLVDSLEGWGVHLPRSPETTDMELSTSRRHHHTDVDVGVRRPLATASQRDLFDLLRSIDGPHDAVELPKPVPEPDAVSVEQLARSRRARTAAEGDAWRAQMELRRRTGSRRNVVHTFVELTKVRLRRPAAGRATASVDVPRVEHGPEGRHHRTGRAGHDPARPDPHRSRTRHRVRARLRDRRARARGARARDRGARRAADREEPQPQPPAR